MKNVNQPVNIKKQNTEKVLNLLTFPAIEVENLDIIFKESEEDPDEDVDTDSKLEQVLYKNIEKQVKVKQIDYGRYQCTISTIIKNYDKFEQKFISFKMPEHQMIGFVMLLAAVQILTGTTQNWVSWLINAVYVVAQTFAVSLAKNQILKSFEHPKLETFNQRAMLISQPLLIVFSSQTLELLILTILVFCCYTIKVISKLEISQNSLQDEMKKHIKLYYQFLNNIREPGQISLLFRKDNLSVLEDKQYQLVCCRGIKAVDVIDSIFSSDNTNDLFQIVHSGMTGSRSVEQTNFVYQDSEMMIPIEYIQSYIIDKFSQNDNALLNLTGCAVQHEILKPTKKSESFLSQIKITKVQLNEGDDYLMVDLFQQMSKPIPVVITKRRKLKKSIGVVQINIVGDNESGPSNAQRQEQQVIFESIQGNLVQLHQMPLLVNRDVPLDLISEHYEHEDDSIVTSARFNSSLNSIHVSSLSQNSSQKNRGENDLMYMGPKRRLTMVEAIDSGSEAPQMTFDLQSQEEQSKFNHTSSSSSEEFTARDPYKITKLNEQLDQEDLQRKATNQHLSKKEVDDMIQSYMKKNQDSQPNSDSVYMQESNEIISDGNSYPSYQNLQNLDQMSCYSIGNTSSGGKHQRGDKNMFICGLTHQQVIELKTAKTNMEFKISSLQNQLNNNKIFLNMVIHDMRNPANAAEYGMEESIKMINELKKEIEKYKINAIKQQSLKKIKLQDEDSNDLNDDFSSHINSDSKSHDNMQRIGSLQIIQSQTAKKMVKYSEGYYVSQQIKPDKYLQQPPSPVRKNSKQKLNKSKSKKRNSNRSVSSSVSKSDNVYQFMTKSPTQLPKIQSIISMDGIGKTKQGPDTDAKPSSLKKYQSCGFSAFSFANHDNEDKKKRNSSNSFPQGDSSDQSKASRLLQKKIMGGNLDRTFSSESSGRKQAAINRAIISGLESCCIERPQSSVFRKLICNKNEQIINQIEQIDLMNYAPQNKRRVRSLGKIHQIQQGSPEKLMKEMGTQTLEEKFKKSCKKCHKIKKIQNSCESCDQHLKFLDSLFQKLLKIHEHVQSAIYSIQLNLNLINDLLDLAKIEQSKFSLVQEYFNMETVVNQALKNVQFLADQKNIKLVLEYDETGDGQSILDSTFRKCTSQKELWLNRKIYGDQRRYMQILLNFISNALKFTLKNGTIKIRLFLIEYQKDIKRRNSCDDLDDGGDSSSQESFKNSAKGIPRSNTSASIGKIQNILETKLNSSRKQSNANVVDQYVKYSLKIEDSGVGIAEENLDKLFVNFGKLGEHDHMNSAGTGLGLSICKQLIEQMGGEVQVTSQLGVGTTFSIIITTKSRVEKKSDSHDNMNKYERQAPQSSLNYLEVPNKASKYATFGRSSEDFSMEGNVMSIKSKNLLKNQSKFSQQHKNMDEDEEMILTNQKKSSHESKFSGQKSQFKDLSSNSGQAGSRNMYKQSSSKSNLNRPKCLIVNDNPIALMQAKFLLQPYCCAVLEAQNGYEAIEIVKQFRPTNGVQKERTIDFIMMDLDMPIMNGWQACLNIRKYQNDDNTLFRVSTQTKLNSNDVSQCGGRSNTDSIVGSALNENLYIFAYSALITQDVEEKALKTGFNKCIEAPLTIQCIEKEIIEYMEQDKVSKKHVASLSFIDDISSIQSNEKMLNRSFPKQLGRILLNNRESERFNQHQLVELINGSHHNQSEQDSDEGKSWIMPSRSSYDQESRKFSGDSINPKFLFSRDKNYQEQQDIVGKKSSNEVSQGSSSTFKNYKIAQVQEKGAEVKQNERDPSLKMRRLSLFGKEGNGKSLFQQQDLQPQNNVKYDRSRRPTAPNISSPISASRRSSRRGSVNSPSSIQGIIPQLDKYRFSKGKVPLSNLHRLRLMEDFRRDSIEYS